MFADLFKKFLFEFDAENLEPLFYEHFRYGTADVYIENDEILGAFRYNIAKSGMTAHVLNLFIKEGSPSTKIMRWFGNRIRTNFPAVKYIKFYRHMKLPGSPARMYKLATLLKER